MVKRASMSLEQPGALERVTGAMIYRTQLSVNEIIRNIKTDFDADGAKCLEIGMGSCAMLSPLTEPNIKGILSRGFGPCQPVSVFVQNPLTLNPIGSDTFCYLYHAHPGIELFNDIVERLRRIPRCYSDITIMCGKTEHSFDPNVSIQIRKAREKLIDEKIVQEINIIEHDLHRSKLYDGSGETFVLTRKGWLINDREILEPINTCAQPPWGIPTGELCASQDPNDPQLGLFPYELGFLNLPGFGKALSHLPAVLLFKDNKYLFCDETLKDLSGDGLSKAILRERCERWFASRGCLREHYPFHLMTISDDQELGDMDHICYRQQYPILIKNNTTEEIYIVGDSLRHHNGIPTQTDVDKNINPFVCKGDILMKSFDHLLFPPVGADLAPISREALNRMDDRIFERIVKQDLYIPIQSNTRRFLRETEEYVHKQANQQDACLSVRSESQIVGCLGGALNTPSSSYDHCNQRRVGAETIDTKIEPAPSVKNS